MARAFLINTEYSHFDTIPYISQSEVRLMLQQDNKRVLAIMPHPDDVEILCAALSSG